MISLERPKVTPLLKIYDKNRNNIVYIKDETKQYTNAFKYRGVYNKFQKINFGNYNGIVTASTGNHAQAVAFAAKQLNIKCLIFIPFNTPNKKEKKILNYNAKIYKNEKLKNYQQCVFEAIEYSKNNNYIYIPSFDDIDIIEGHKSMLNEIDMKNIDYCFCPVGGGGLVSSILSSNNKCKVYGVELIENDAMNQSLNSNSAVEIELNIKDNNSYCEGILVSKIGEIPFKIAKNNNLEIILVTEEEIKKSIQKLNRINIKSEGAGASSFAAYLNSNIKDSNVLCIISGGNIDDNIFESILKEVI